MDDGVLSIITAIFIRERHDGSGVLDTRNGPLCLVLRKVVANLLNNLLDQASVVVPPIQAMETVDLRPVEPLALTPHALYRGRRQIRSGWDVVDQFDVDFRAAGKVPDVWPPVEGGIVEHECQPYTLAHDLSDLLEDHHHVVSIEGPALQVKEYFPHRGPDAAKDEDRPDRGELLQLPHWLPRPRPVLRPDVAIGREDTLVGHQ